MTPFLIGNIQFTFSLLLYTLISVGYIFPALKKIVSDKALVPLLLIHCFRYAPLSLLMPGQVSEEFPLEAAQIISYGNFIAALFALLAVTMIWHNIKGARFAVWLFSLIGIAVVIISAVTGIGIGATAMEIGFNLYVLNFYVPMLIVSHVMIVLILLRKQINN